MTALWFSPPAKALDANADPMSGAIWYFYLSGTLTSQNVYSDAALTTSLGDHVTADSAGKFASIYLDANKLYRAVLKSSDNSVTIHDIDPVNPQTGYLCQVTGTGNASTSSGVVTVISWDTEIYDAMGMHSTSVNSDTVNILVSGYYWIRGKLTYAANSSGYRSIQLQKNGSALVTNSVAATTGEVTVANIDEFINLTAGDTIKIAAKQDGGTINVSRADSYLRVERLRTA